MLFHKYDVLAEVNLPTPTVVQTLPEQVFEAINEVVPVQSRELAVFDPSLEFIDISNSNSRAEVAIAEITRPEVEKLLNNPNVDPLIFKATYIAVMAQRTLTLPGDRRMLEDRDVLTWHTDILSLITSNRLVTTYAVGSFEMPAKQYRKVAGMAEYLRRYERKTPGKFGISLPEGLTPYVPAPYEIIQQDEHNPHESSVNYTAEPIDSTLIAFLPYFQS